MIRGRETLIEEVKSPFIMPLDLTYAVNSDNLTIPQIAFDGISSDRNLTFTDILLNVTYKGTEKWPYEHREVHKFESANTVIKFDSYTGIMVYLKHWNNTENEGQVLTFALMGNNKDYPINLDVQKKVEIGDEGTCIIPDYLISIIHDPPGDHSYSTLSASTKITTGFNVESSISHGLFADVEVSGGVGGDKNEVGVGVNLDVDWTYDETYSLIAEITYGSTLSSSTNSENAEFIGPGKGDLYYGVGLILKYYFMVNNYYITVGNVDPVNENYNDIKVWENGSHLEYGLNISSQFSILGGYIGEYNLSKYESNYLEDFNLTSLEAYNVFADNKISAEEACYVEEIGESPLFWTPEYYIEFFYQNTSSITRTYSLEFQISVDTYFFWDAELNVFGAKLGTEGKIGYSFDWSRKDMSISATESNKQIVCHLEDDDGMPIGEHDQFLVHVYRDLRYNTYGIIFDENYTYTSRPYEDGTRDRRNPTEILIVNMEDDIRGTVNIQCYANDDETGVKYVQFFYDTNPIYNENSIPIGFQDNVSAGSTNTYQIEWDTAGLHGTYYLFAMVFDNADPTMNYLISEPCEVYIDNVLPSACEIRTYGPYRNAINLYARALDSDSGIEYVEYWDGNPGEQGSIYLGRVSSAENGYRLIWATDPLGSDDGIHHIYARAYDRAGNYLDSTAVTILVDNIQGNYQETIMAATPSILLLALLIGGAIGISIYASDKITNRKRLKRIEQLQKFGLKGTSGKIESKTPNKMVKKMEKLTIDELKSSLQGQIKNSLTTISPEIIESIKSLPNLSNTEFEEIINDLIQLDDEDVKPFIDLLKKNGGP
ncbi:MAG: hypothetical protein ACTSRW_16630 [Candidatus Helarchaeota archaeon]